jgi:hypothetical protein
MQAGDSCIVIVIILLILLISLIPIGVGRSFENRSFENSSKTGQRMDWGPQGFTFSTFFCFPNLT